MEVFDNEKTLKPEEPGQVVAVKELQGNSNHDGKSCIKGQIITDTFGLLQSDRKLYLPNLKLKVTLRTTQLNHFSL